MLDLVLWSNSRGVFHGGLACDNFVMKGDTLSDIKNQGNKPVVGLIDFGASIVSPAVYEDSEPHNFVAEYEHQWHKAATHGRAWLTDPFAVSRDRPFACAYEALKRFRRYCLVNVLRSALQKSKR